MRTDLFHLIFAPMLYCLWVGGAVSQSAEADDWTRQKCDLYSAAWQDVEASQGMAGVSDDFLEKNRNFIALGCPESMRICAVSPEDIDLANLLTVLSMNEGMASTFVPFGCPD